MTTRTKDVETIDANKGRMRRPPTREKVIFKKSYGCGAEFWKDHKFEENAKLRRRMIPLLRPFNFMLPANRRRHDVVKMNLEYVEKSAYDRCRPYLF
jgi:hypothetical protein